MAKTLLNGINEVLKKAKLIAGDAGQLSSLVDSSRQVYVDNAISAWNEAIEQLYDVSDLNLPKEVAENTITLVSGDRDYALEDDLVQFRFPLIDETNGNTIESYPGGYTAMVNSQLIPSNYTGQPFYGAIRPTDGQLYLDRIPTEDGLIYKYRYDKDISLSSASDTFPFTDQVFRAMVPVVTELWKRYQGHDFDAGFYYTSMGRASRLLSGRHARRTYISRIGSVENTDPYGC